MDIKKLTRGDAIVAVAALLIFGFSFAAYFQGEGEASGLQDQRLVGRPGPAGVLGRRDSDHRCGAVRAQRPDAPVPARAGPDAAPVGGPAHRRDPAEPVLVLRGQGRPRAGVRRHLRPDRDAHPGRHRGGDRVRAGPRGPAGPERSGGGAAAPAGAYGQPGPYGAAPAPQPGAYGAPSSQPGAAFGGAPAAAPAGTDAFQPYWFSVPEQRQLVDANTNAPTGSLNPGVWYLAVAQHGQGLLVEVDGVRGVLWNVQGIQKS
ncbi:hypothetical protein ACU686_38270 [Yinghuangia aomiensis]